MSNRVIITGASGGFGALTVKTLLNQGHNVVATMRNTATKNKQIADLINTPAGKRPVRTVVDKMGMGDHLNPYNEQLNQIHNGIFNAFGMGDMLNLKV